MLLERARRATRWGAFSLLLWALFGAWLSVAIYYGLRIYLPDVIAAAGVSIIALLIYGLASTWRGHRQRKKQRAAQTPPSMPSEMIEILERWTAEQPWLAVGIAAGAGWMTARSDGDPEKTMHQLLDVLRGMEAARQAQAGAQ
ncbi:MAG: hypothetical protein CMP06_07335 [Xanthomonadales bacterium]|mgnify:FL=1|nr:hypothetical protein [Xanthomonadales bacterium]